MNVICLDCTPTISQLSQLYKNWGKLERKNFVVDNGGDDDDAYSNDDDDIDDEDEDDMGYGNVVDVEGLHENVSME